MHDFFFTPRKKGQGIFKEKGSKFFAESFPVSGDQDIELILSDVKSRHHSARHHCYAWVIGPDYDRFRAHDDGEPSHSAGDPILGQIRSNELTNCLVIVTRYFGGTKLGVSGLINAYKTAASMAIEEGQKVKVLIKIRFEVQFGYEQTTPVQKFIHDSAVSVESQEFDSRCKMIITCARSRELEIMNLLEDLKQSGGITAFSKILST